MTVFASKGDCELRRVDAGDLQRLFDWRNSSRVRQASMNAGELRWDEHVAWFASLSTMPQRMVLMFVQNGVPTGRMQFEIDADHGRASWGFLIGDPGAPKGSGGRMGYMALELAFGAMGLHRVMAEVIAGNDVSTRYHQTLGFSTEGLLREHLLREKRRLDVALFGLLAREWQAQRTGIERRYFSKEQG